MRKSEDVRVQFGRRVRELRKQRGISQEELGFRANLDRTYVSGIERGVRNVGLKNIAALSSALGVSLTVLFQGVEER
jgi:transcriptional regulator with XRE-family HTH domain